MKMEEIIYNQNGDQAGKINLPSSIFDLEINGDLVHQVVVAHLANKRKVIAHTKDRSEVRGGGKKPWRQKGTGRARHGSIRSPIWRGGGITFGPTKDRNFSKKINKKMRRKALFMSLSSKVKDKEIVLIDKIELTEAKTKIMSQALNNLSSKMEKDFKKGTLIVLPSSDKKLSLASRNIQKIKLVGADNLNLLDILSHRYLLILSPKETVKIIEKKYKG
ncbi:50S ribosomal protein L4 [Patescibacteria group bacterium]|nr:50S ribosomal protein L4 [Patescibacteria group bacterium]